MNLREKTEGVLEHFDYALIKCSGYDFDNVLVYENTTPKILFNYVTIMFGAERVSKVKGAVKVTR